jgi:hypothetical protein
VRAAPELLGAPTIGGGSARPWGGGGEVIYTFTAVRNSENGKKTGGFAHVLAYKTPKTPFFALKYLTRYTHETFFEVYTNFEGPYLSRCRDIPFQSFGSHIRPQPHGLGLILCIVQPTQKRLLIYFRVFRQTLPIFHHTLSIPIPYPTLSNT